VTRIHRRIVDRHDGNALAAGLGERDADGFHLVRVSHVQSFRQRLVTELKILWYCKGQNA